MTTDKTPTEALAQLRHLYAQLKSQDGMSRTDRARIADGILSPAIAALEKWGQPAQAAEPVAWLDPWTGTKVTTDYDAYGKHGIPLVVAQQAGAVPLDEARRLFDAGWKAAALFCDREDVVADGIIGFGACPQFEAAFSAAHGIKGGQHVE